MFWKVGNLFSFKSQSIATRLMLHYSFATISIVLVACYIVFPTFEKVVHFATPNTKHLLWEGCIKRLSVALLLSSLCAILFGSIVARRGMGRIGDLADKMEKFSLESMATEKFNPDDWPNELKPLGKSFNVMLDKLQRSYSQLAQFSADIAHELRSPIHNILGINEVALMQAYSSERQRDIIQSNVEECRHLLTLIENLWFLARSDHGQMTINKELIQASEQIEKMCEYYEPHASDKDVELVQEGNAWLSVDTTLFKRVISNVLSNAIRYTPERGKVYIKINCLADEVCVCINDSGIGIESRHLPKIFDRFYRADPSRSSLTGGLGLGLAIVKSIMDLHNGRVSINSEINKGTTIQLYFPAPLLP